MATMFLIVIYLAFISLGLPDSLLGVSWPQMRLHFGVPLESAGLIFMFTAAGTIVSSFASGFMLKKLGVGMVAFISTLLTAVPLLVFPFVPSFAWLFVLAIPLGLGAGSIDAALNHYVAVHYKAHHMSWLHCFWGIGATSGPIVMSGFIQQGEWAKGYLTVGIVQLCFSGILLISLPLWKKVADRLGENAPQEQEETGGTDMQKPLSIPGAKLAMLAFACYCGAEATMGLWGSSFLIHTKGLTAAVAAQWVSLFYGGITVGRFVSGFATLRLSNQKMIRLGQGILLLGVLLLLLPLPSFATLAGFILIGLGCAPIYPCMLHDTPVIFGKKAAQSLIGYQMAFAYMGTTFLPPLLGYSASFATIGILPVFILVYVVVMFLGTERVRRPRKL